MRFDFKGLNTRLVPLCHKWMADTVMRKKITCQLILRVEWHIYCGLTHCICQRQGTYNMEIIDMHSCAWEETACVWFNYWFMHLSWLTCFHVTKPVRTRRGIVTKHDGHAWRDSPSSLILQPISQNSILTEHQNLIRNALYDSFNDPSCQYERMRNTCPWIEFTFPLQE
jgi:hypothetical protein